MLVSLWSGSSRGSSQANSLTIGADTAAAIRGDFAGHYVNYHTSQDPEGAVRGQLRWR